MLQRRLGVGILYHFCTELNCERQLVHKMKIQSSCEEIGYSFISIIFNISGADKLHNTFVVCLAFKVRMENLRELAKHVSAVCLGRCPPCYFPVGHTLKLLLFLM